MDKTANAMQELMDMKIWMLWRWATDKGWQTDEEILLRLAVGQPAQMTNGLHTWVTYDEAVKAQGA